MLTRPSVDNGTPSGTGVLLTATAGTYTNSPTSYSREWRRNGVAIGGETGLTYTTASSDQGKYLSFYEKAINGVGDSGFIRAETGNARQIFLTGDSLIANRLCSARSQLSASGALVILRLIDVGLSRLPIRRNLRRALSGQLLCRRLRIVLLIGHVRLRIERRLAVSIGCSNGRLTVGVCRIDPSLSNVLRCREPLRSFQFRCRKTLRPGKRCRILRLRLFCGRRTGF